MFNISAAPIRGNSAVFCVKIFLDQPSSKNILPCVKKLCFSFFFAIFLIIFLLSLSSQLYCLISFLFLFCFVFDFLLSLFCSYCFNYFFSFNFEEYNAVWCGVVLCVVEIYVCMFWVIDFVGWLIEKWEMRKTRIWLLDEVTRI